MKFNYDKQMTVTDEEKCLSDKFHIYGGDGNFKLKYCSGAPRSSLQMGTTVCHTRREQRRWVGDDYLEVEISWMQKASKVEQMPYTVSDTRAESMYLTRLTAAVKIE